MTGNNKIFQEKKIWLRIAVIFTAVFLIIFLVISSVQKNMDERRLEFISERDAMIKEMLENGNYSCCLQKPCTYCIEKHPKHGEGATCNCLEDVVTGKHPCGECMGEILEGHGNPYLANYFAKAISEEVGEQYLGTLRQIISEKYGIPIDQQVS